jgi:tetraacyldisaccharide 4'-kinase
MLSVKRVAAPVISVGNITAGGTGKTPFVEMLIRMLTQRGEKIAMISRGYRRTTSGTVIVSDGVALRESVERSGDEPFQIARKFPHVYVIVDEQRARGAQLAVDKFGPDVIVLDDGFQHRPLHRDLDIVLMEGDGPLSSLRLLPAGVQREPLSALIRADLLAVSSVSGGTVHVQELQRVTKAPVIKVHRKAQKLVALARDREMELSKARGKACIAFCGIGNPGSFRRTLDEIGVEVREFIVFPDHHAYTALDLRGIVESVESNNPDIVLMTEKDAVVWQSSIQRTLSLLQMSYYLEIEMEIIEGAELLQLALDGVLKEAA